MWFLRLICVIFLIASIYLKTCSSLTSNKNNVTTINVANVKKSDKHIDFEPKELLLPYWNKAEIIIKFQPLTTSTPMTTLIVYPCGIISGSVAHNHSSSSSTTTRHHNHNDLDLKRLLNETEARRGGERCGYSVVYDDASSAGFEGQVTFNAKYQWVGVGSLDVFAWENEKDILKLETKDARQNKMTIMVTPPKYKFKIFPMLAIFVGFAFNIFGFGLTLKKPDVLPYIKRPTEMIFLAFSQFLIWPALAMVFNFLLDPPAHFQFIFLAICAASSGAFTNLFTILTKARLNLNVLSLILWPVLGIGVIPLWVTTLGIHLLTNGYPRFTPCDIEAFPWAFFIALKVLFIVPGLLGFIGSQYFPKQARILSLVVRPLAILFVFVMMMMTLYDHYWSLVYASQWRVVLGPVLLPMTGGILVFMLSLVVVRNAKTALTLTIQTITPNPAYALLCCTLMVPKPYNSACISIVIVYFFTIVFITIVTSSFLGFIRYIRARKDNTLCLLREQNDQAISTISGSKVDGPVLESAVKKTGGNNGESINSSAGDFKGIGS